MLDGFIHLRRDSGVALAEQIYRQLRDAVRQGHFPAGQALPSSRALAAALGVSRNTVNAALDLLKGEGIIAVSAGAAPVLTRQPAPAAAPIQPARARLSPRGARMAAQRFPDTAANGLLRPGQPDPALFPADLWARALRRAAREGRGQTLLYAHRTGLPALQSALAQYLAQSRGVKTLPGQILVLPTVQSGLALLAQCLASPGDTVWIEDPGYPSARLAFAAAGLTLAPLPVDRDGGDAGAARGAPTLIYVTPSNQYPTGVRMKLARRLALLAAARQHGAVVLEDDYDSEFLWQGRPIAALQGLSEAGEVIYIGTPAKSLLPGLRLAYMVVPPNLAEPLSRAQSSLGLLANVHTQAAFADFIEAGHFRAHLNKISKAYEARGRLVVGALQAICGNHVAVELPQGGLQVMVRFDPAIDDTAVAGRLLAAGFNVPPLSGYYLGAGSRGVVAGFAAADAPIAQRFATTLRDALR